MPWQMQMLWPEFVKKRLCRYLLQHYLGHFFKEKISLDQLTLDIYNGTGCVKNLNLDCDALNEQINSAASLSSANPNSNTSFSSVPIEIVSGFVGYISVYIPWHDLFNDYCKLTIKNVQITIRTKQRKKFHAENLNHQAFQGDLLLDDDEDDENLDSSASNSMFSSMFIDSLMNTSMHIAQECLSDPPPSASQENISKPAGSNSSANSLLGLEAFASTIDSILSRIKINLEQIQIRIEDLDGFNFSTNNTNQFNSNENIMSSSTLINNKPSNGIALELRIKSIKYFDVDSSNNTSNQNKSNTNSLEQAQPQHVVRNTTKSFNIEGLTIYFDEFIIKDDINDFYHSTATSNNQQQTIDENFSLKDLHETSLNSTVDLSDISSSFLNNNTISNSPKDESPPFNYELNPDLYLYTNPIICLTFSGMQTIKLTINNMRPSDFIMEAANSNNNNNNNGQNSINPNQLIQQQQRPLLELNAQFGSIKCLLCPRQIHLLVDMFTKLNDYINDVNEAKKAYKQLMQQKYKRNLSTRNYDVRGGGKPIRGCDKRKFQSLIQNELLLNTNPENYNEEEEDEDEQEIDLNNLSEVEQSCMFYSMTSQSMAANYIILNDSPNESSNNTQSKKDDTRDLTSNSIRKTIDLLQNDTVLLSNKNNLFQTFRITFRMFSLTVLHHDPSSSNQQKMDDKKLANNSVISSSLIKRLIVNRMKPISDMYFDFESTIDASSSSLNQSFSSSSSSTIEKSIIMKYHQACAFNDHFLLLLKPINFNLIQKISQHKFSKQKSIQYSFNDISLNIGYIQLNEYLISNSTSLNINNTSNTKSSFLRYKSTQMLEACKSACITELIHFTHSEQQSSASENQSNTIQNEQPCFKLQMVIYEPLNLSNNNVNKILNQNSNLLLNRPFENINIQLNQCLVCELDISIIDRLYYLINDITKVSGEEPKTSKISNKISTDKISNKLSNYEIECTQLIKLGLRFPIADLRRVSQPKNSNNEEKNKQTTMQTTSKQQQHTMIALRNLRDQILTLHLFEFHFQTTKDDLETMKNNRKLEENDHITLKISSSQINGYYQDNKKERPIHFGLMQQKENEAHSLYCSIKIPIESSNKNNNFDFSSQLLSADPTNNHVQFATLTEFDSLKHNYNINVTKPNRFHTTNTTIKEEDEEEDDEDKEQNSESNEESYDNEDDEEDEEDDGNYGPFSRIHSAISSEKNRRIVNAGNKQEMQQFVDESKNLAQTCIQLIIPNIKLLIADQKFLNDIYNCFLNDLIMWVPSKLPPLESSFTLNNLLETTMPINPLLLSPNLNYLIDSNLNSEFILNTRKFENVETEEKMLFHMCKSSIDNNNSRISSDSASSLSDETVSDSEDSKSKRKFKRKNNKTKKNKFQQHTKRICNKLKKENSICFIIQIEQAHLKAFVLNNLLQQQLHNQDKQHMLLKYGEFDIKLEKFQMCLTSWQNVVRKFEKQFISILTDRIQIDHSTKQCPPGIQALKYPTNYASFDNLFQMSKTKELIKYNDPSITKSLFEQQTNQNNNNNMNINDSLLSIPMVSIGIKSKFDMKKNTKQLLVALNFNDLSLNHMFCSQNDFWIFQLILLFDLIDIDIVGYEAPLVLTELHLNVSNSCIIYKPLYLSTSSLIAFKSLHWSSNVTAESTLTLLVFNIEDIYLFISKITDSNNVIDLKRDYVCVANSYLFELRLLICDEEPKYKEKQMILKQLQQSVEMGKFVRKAPILDIKLRSNLIQVRTCVDSAFALIELINYIVSDGDLHQLNPIMSEFMTPNNVVNNNLEGQTLLSLQHQQNSNVADELSNAIGSESLPPNLTRNMSFNNMNKQPISSSIPIQPSVAAVATASTTFTIGTPPPSSSFKSSSSSASLNQQQQFYSPAKNNVTNVSMSSGSSYQDTNNQVPLPSPSLSYNFKLETIKQHEQMSTSSAESLISDMVKEAMTQNAMTQSIIGSLDNDVRSTKITARKRNTSLTLAYPDMHSKRNMLARGNSFCATTTLSSKVDNNLNIYKDFVADENEEDDLIRSNSSTVKTLKEKDLNRDDESEEDNLTTKNYKNLFEEENEENEEDDDEDENLIRSIDRNHHNRMKKDKKDEDVEEDEEEEDEEDEEDFHFDLPFSDLSPMSPKKKNTDKNSSSSNNSVQRQLQFVKNNRRLYFKPRQDEEEEEEEDEDEEDENDNDDDELLRDFDIIDVIPGFGEPPKNNQDFEIKIIKKDRSESIEIKEDHFKKPLSKIDVLKAPDSYPVPINVYCVQEISINWCLYGGSDFGCSSQLDDEQIYPIQEESNTSNKMNRTVSSPIIVNQNSNNINNNNNNNQITNYSGSPYNMATRSRTNSTSSNSLSVSPNSHSLHHYLSLQSPPKNSNNNASKQTPTSPLVSNNSANNQMVKFSSKSSSVNFSKEKCLPRKAGGRIYNKYDTNSLTWLARGGRKRNLDVCMEIALHKVKTKIDLYTDLNEIDAAEIDKDNPYLYRVALAIGDIEIKDKLASSAFNMFLFRYESDSCPKHTNSNMIFLKFLCSKSMDAQRLLECDIKVSIQPLRFNIDQDSLIFMVEFFTKLASKDLNEFSKQLVPPPPPPTPIVQAQNNDESILPPPTPSLQTQQSPQQVFIRNFIFSPDLLVKFDFSGKYDKRPDNKMDTITKLLMVVVQLSNTEIKLKRIYYRRGFLGVEKLFNALIREWLSDIQRNQMKNLIKGWGIFNSLIQFFEGFTYLIWYPIEQYRKDGRVLCGIQKGSAAFSTCTVLATIELTNRMFQATKNVAEFFYDLVTPHRNNQHHFAALGYSAAGGANNVLIETILTGVGNNRNIRLRRQPSDIREGLQNAYYVMYEGINDTAANLIQEINQGAEHKGLPGAIGGALRQLPSTTLAPIVLTAEATCNILSGIRNQLKPDEKKDDDQKWKVAYNS